MSLATQARQRSLSGPTSVYVRKQKLPGRDVIHFAKNSFFECPLMKLKQEVALQHVMELPCTLDMNRQSNGQTDREIDRHEDSLHCI